MNTLTHQQAQEMIRAGQEVPEMERKALGLHLSACADCQAYAALVDELNRTVPALYSAPAFSERELRQKADDKRILIRRHSIMNQISQGARAVLFIGAALALLLLLVILSPRLLPEQPGPGGGNVPSAVIPSATIDTAPTLPPVAPGETLPAASSIQYTVVAGDNVVSIAEKFNLEPQTILWANEEQLQDNPNNVQPGMTLRIPTKDGLYYRWQTGDTIEAVAGQFGVEPQALLEWPENPGATLIQPGTLVFIPGGKRPLQPAAAPSIDVANSVRIVSPDGRLAAVYQSNPGLLRVDVVESGQTQVRAFANVVNPSSWSPDSRWILFWEGDPINTALQADGLSLWALDVATGEAKLLSTTTVTDPTYQSWSPDGSRLVFTNGGYRSAQVDKWLSIFNAGTGQISDLIPKETLVSGKVSWSPDGKWIAVAAVEGSKTGPEYADNMGWDNPAIAARRIYLVDPATGEFQRLTQSEAYEDAPRWSRDGKQLFFVQAVGTQARMMAAYPETGAIVTVPSCEIPMPPSTDYYGGVDWSRIYPHCDTSRSENDTAEFDLYFYRPLVVNYDPAIWEDRSEPGNQEKMVNYLQHRALENCTVSVRGPSGFYPENMPDLTLGEITYQVYQEQLAGGTIVRDYFFKSATTDDFAEVVKTLGIPIFAVQYNPSEAPDCHLAAETLFATLHPSVQPPSTP
jgi:LysM repeat protein